MRIVNEDTDDVIPRVRRCDTFLSRCMGLRFRTPGRAYLAFSRDTRAAIDMLFVRGPIDIAFLDRDHEIIEIHGAPPVTMDPHTWRMYRPDEPYRAALEVEKGLLKERGWAAGHTLRPVE